MISLCLPKLTCTIPLHGTTELPVLNSSTCMTCTLMNEVREYRYLRTFSASSLLSASAEAELRRFAPCLRPQPFRESGHREVYPAKPLDLPFIYSFKNDNGNFSFVEIIYNNPKM